jgi:uncharacterized protein (DUF362 family)
LSVVYYCETRDRRNFVAKTLEKFSKQLGTAKRVFIKPNIVSAEPYPTTTHPEVLDSLLSELTGCEIIVGDGPAVDAGRSDKVLRNTPLRMVCEKHNVGLVDLYSEPMKHLKSKRGYSLRVSAVPLSCDFVISIPVLKVHNICCVSGALKNQFGYLSRKDRILMHMGLKDIHKGIAEVNAAVPTNLFVVDAVKTMVKAQECRHGGHPADLEMMIAGVDPVGLDSFGLELLQRVEPELKAKRPNMRYLDYAIDYGLGNAKYEMREI